MISEIEVEMDKINHIAITVTNIKHATNWYTKNFDCKVKEEYDNWVLLEFDNIDLALVLPHEHPPHIAFVDESIKGEKHKDGSEYIYDHDTFGNIIERIKYDE